jgi:hypothetical protein
MVIHLKYARFALTTVMGTLRFKHAWGLNFFFLILNFSKKNKIILFYYKHFEQKRISVFLSSIKAFWSRN